MARSRIQIAKADIVSHFDQLPNPVLKLKEVRDILTTQRSFWRLAASTTAAQFISFLTDHSKLKVHEFPFPQRSETAYVWGDVPFLQVLLNLKKNIHFSHYTAVRMLGLTEQVPHSIYLTNERATWPTDPPELTQSEIDDSFKRPERLTNNWIEQGGKKIFLLNGAGTGHLGVVVQPANDDDGRVVQARLTNMERTLIDITVRPAYAGGVFEVAKAFELAKDRVSVNKLVPMLRKLDFAYPYHQAIGYYLERAGYKPAQLDLIRRIPMVHDFYLAHDMPDTRYEQTWRLFVPKGF